MSPTRMLWKGLLTNSWPSCTCVTLELVFLSLRYLRKSSIPSLSILTQSTNTSGAIALNGASGEMIEIDCSTAVTRKYQLERRLNW